MNTFTVGADPEIFVSTYGGKPVPAGGLVQGTKEKPFKVNKGAVQVDGTALEFNIEPSQGSLLRVVDNYFKNVSEVKTRIVELASEKYGKRLKISPEVTRIWDKETWDSIPDQDKVLGCEPDYSAYTRDANPRPDPEGIGMPTMRTAGGHIHIGWEKPRTGQDHFLDCVFITKCMDMLLFSGSHLWDKDDQRRKLYGQPGSFRPKPFGVEYRPLSNAWVTHKKAEQIQKAISGSIQYFFYYCRYNSAAFNYKAIMEAKSYEALRKEYLPDGLLYARAGSFLDQRGFKP